MKSEWRVSTNYVCGGKEYQVYRLLDVDKTDESGNREYDNTIFTSKDRAVELANDLNKEEAENFWRHKND